MSHQETQAEYMLVSNQDYSQRAEFLSSLPIQQTISRYMRFKHSAIIADVGHDPDAPLIDLPYKSGSVDIVVHDLVVPYIVSIDTPFYRSSLAEVDRVLTPGGWLIVTTPGHDNLPGYQRIMELIGRKTGFSPAPVGAPYDLRGELRETLKEALPSYDAQTFVASSTIHFPTAESNWDLLATILPLFQNQSGEPVSQKEYLDLVREAKIVLDMEEECVFSDKTQIDITVAIKPDKLS